MAQNSSPSPGACWKRSDHCVDHDGQCPVAPPVPPAQPLGAGGSPLPWSHFWVEVAGTTCVAWSSVGAGWKWLDASSLPCLVWCYWVRGVLPDAVIHEITALYCTTVMLEIWAGCFDVSSVVCSPTVGGVPSSRRRKYTLGLSQAWIENQMRSSRSAAAALAGTDSLPPGECQDDKAVFLSGPRDHKPAASSQRTAPWCHRCSARCVVRSGVAGGC